jgi:hypothetical protein
MVCYRRTQRWKLVLIPQADSCRALLYYSVRELAAQPHMARLSDRVLAAYEEEVTDWGRRHELSDHENFIGHR